MACDGLFRVVVDAKGKVVRSGLKCKGACDDGSRCRIQESRDHHGSTRQWCGCEELEPKECHLVVYTPGVGHGGGPSEIVCAGDCEEGECGPEPVVVDERKVMLSWRPFRLGTRYDFKCVCG